MFNLLSIYPRALSSNSSFKADRLTSSSRSFNCLAGKSFFGDFSPYHQPFISSLYPHLLHFEKRVLEYLLI